MISSEELSQRTELAVACLRTAVNYCESYGGPVVDGQQYSPSDRAVPHAEFVYQNGTDEQWEKFLYALEGAYEAFDIVWVDGIAWRADDVPADD